MSILFSAYINDFKNLTHLSNEIMVESQKIAAQTSSKIKNGFTSFLSSISNSFTSLQKMFSFSAENSKFYSDEKNSSYQRATPSVIVDNAKENTAEDLSSKSAHQERFDKLKAEMHARLNICLNQKNNA
ncbi:hypothetical protein [Klebsiella sp. BIGb0407]|uniref:hypothetical protein n=1 Tax=Klebsiella sp. BIGb0407 TaxID=2940603 RepID=UPI0021676CA3|nr:hypothetical protein [Klebsiella sp. BIGb0407]MCS3431531.1 hypothetical protein [Klebsiella sp. BIGb0407]